MDNIEVKKKDRTLLVGLAIVIVIMVCLCIAGIFLVNPPEETVQGQVEATNVRISGKLPGRIVAFYVEEGQHVKKGDTLAYIHSSTVDAKLYQAQAIEQAASAQNRKAEAGTRSQIISGAYDLWQQAVAAESIHKKTYERVENLFKQNVVSEQKRDEARAAYDAAVAQASAAKSQYELALEGAQAEDKAAARAQQQAARGTVMEVESMLEDRYLTAPCDGEITDIFPHIGELVGTGTPIMNVMRNDDRWVTFNVREELLNKLTMGKEIEVMIPALGKKETTLKIFYIKDMGSYAVWNATKASGQYDSKTFQVKARPVEPIENLRPGMSVIMLDAKQYEQ